MVSCFVTWLYTYKGVKGRFYERTIQSDACLKCISVKILSFCCHAYIRLIIRQRTVIIIIVEVVLITTTTLRRILHAIEILFNSFGHITLT